MRNRNVRTGAIVAACVALLTGAAGCGPAARDDGLAFYAAASLRDVVRDLAPACMRATGVAIEPHFAGSGALTRQIELGGRADVFFSADASWVDRLQRAGLVEAGSRVDLLTNTLVVVVPRDASDGRGAAGDAAAAEDGAADVLRRTIGRIAIADPVTVPAGRYARDWLRREGLWDALRARVVPALDVRAALAAVEAGAVDAGVVYATDAATSDRVRVAGAIPADRTPEIVYTVAALAARPRLMDSRRVLAWLGGPQARSIFERHGFRPRAR